MRTLRRTIELKDGVKVEMLFTPHLYSFKGWQGIDFSCGGTQAEVMALYADVMCAAALNAWVLDGHDEGGFAFRRSDFHEWGALNPQDFAEAMDFALVALTGKGIKDYTTEKGKDDGEGSPEKKHTRLTGRR